MFSRTARPTLACAAACAVALAGVVAAPAALGEHSWRVVRVSVGDDDRQAALGESFPDRPSVSASGRYVSFASKAPGLVAGDTNRADDVFVRDRLTGSTELVSVGTRGQQAADGADEGTISANGRRVVFTTTSPLVSRDTNETADVYVRDRWTGRTMLVSQRPDGRAGNRPSYLAHLSRTGRYVVFQSSASNLVAEDTNRREDAFLRDLVTGRTERVSVISAGYGGQAAGTEPRVSPDGKRVLFSSLNADESTTLWVHNREREVTRLVDTGVTGHAVVGSWSMSAGGRYVAFVTDRALVRADTNDEIDPYRLDRRTGAALLLSVGSSGQQGNSFSDAVELAADGKVAAFSSVSSNLVAEDTNGLSDVFLRRIPAGTTQRVSVSSTGAQGNGDSSYSRDLAISADGLHVAFGSFAANLVAHDTNGQPDVFVWDATLH
jgi:Tol biopolymer transport system component